MRLHLAGFDVTGIDIMPQPNYPFRFFQSDALNWPLRNGGFLKSRPCYHFIWASPPCQAYSPLNAYNKKTYPDLVARTRAILVQSEIPYVIENVVQAPLKNAVMLCGSMFGLKIYRHRNFEASFPLEAPKHPKHEWTCQRNGYLPSVTRSFMTITGGKHSIAWRERAAAEMGVPWMKTTREICEAIPPLYAQFIAQQYLAA